MSWTDEFPDNFMWSNAVLVCKGMAPYGAVALGEIDSICGRIRGRRNDPHAWVEEWHAMAARLEAEADTAAREGRSHTAGNCYLRAGNYYYTGERFIPPGDEKRASYLKALRCYQEGLRRRHPDIEFVEVPYENTTLPAYFVKAKAGGRAPTIVLFDGMDNCKEMSVLFAGLEFAQRGYNTLAIDGPGQGEALRARDIHARHDYEVAGTAAYEYVAARVNVDSARVAVMGYSFGGYYAPRAAAFEPRFAACVALGALHWDVYAWQSEMRRRAAASPGTIAQSNFQFRWILGAADDDEALERAKRFTLEGVASRVKCPFLVLRGEHDRIVPVQAAHDLYAAIGSTNKTIRIFTVGETGAEHCQVDNRQAGIDYVGDWLAQVL